MKATAGSPARSAPRFSFRAQEARRTLTAHNFEAVFLEHWPRIYRHLLRLVGDHAEAEDLALETFWRLHERVPAIPEGSSLGGWLFRVATRLGLNAIRAAKRRARYEQAAGEADLAARPADDPAQAFARQEEQRRVRLVLQRMNARQAQLLLMRQADFSYAEMAAAAGVSAASIGTLLARAEREFERRYQALEPGAEQGGAHAPE